MTRQLLSTLEQGKTYTLPLVVKSTARRETKAKKPYLTLELFDGHDEIHANYWDWGGANVPDNNTILDVTADVTSWQGAVQLTVRSMCTNTTLTIADFMPASDYDISTVYKDAYCIAAGINDDFLRGLCLGILEESVNLWLTVPAACNVHHAYKAGTLIHSVSVTKIAMAMAQQMPYANLDLVTAGALLHDVGKLYGYTINGVTCSMTDEGMLFDHLFMGAEFVGNYAKTAHLIDSPEDEQKLEMLRHIILSHHGSADCGAVVPPALLEAYIVFHADCLDATAEQIKVASEKSTGKWTDKIWALNNKPHLSIGYVQEVLVP